MTYPTPMDIAEAEDREDNRLESEQTMMKIELVKETMPDGSIRYSVETDGVYVTGTVTSDEAEAHRFYTRCVEHRGRVPKREVILSAEITP